MPIGNPVLDVKRKEYLKAGEDFRNDLIHLYKQSIQKSSHIHANLLFKTSSGYSIMKAVCRCVTNIEPTVFNISWKDLAAKLGYDDQQIKGMGNLRGPVYDPTEQLIKFYASTNDGTVGNLMQGLFELGFYPALQEIHKLVDDLLAEIEVGKIDLIELPIQTPNGDAKIIFKAANFDSSDLPLIYNNTPIIKTSLMVQSVGKIRDREMFHSEVLQRASPQSNSGPRQRKRYSKVVMLSFASDGFNVAQKVASVFRSTKSKSGLPIGVLMLHENESQIRENPSQTITYFVSQVDFVVPVLTEGYFSALNQMNNRSQLLDERYVSFIFDIAVSKYVQNNCINLQVRPILPIEAYNKVCANQEFIHNPIFNAWKSEDEISLLATSILKSRYKYFNQ